MPRAKKPKADPGPPEEVLGGDGEVEQAGVRPFWSGTITFGLVTIPVDLYSATRSTRTSLRMLAPDGTPVVRRYFDETGKQIADDSLERGYELEDGKFVTVTDEELEGLAPEQSRDIDLTRFVDENSIPPLFFERAYVLAPSGNSTLAYRLLASTLERTHRAGIASFVMRGKQYVVAIGSEKGLLRAETLRFAEELRTPETIGLPARGDGNPQKVKALRAVIRQRHAEARMADELTDAYSKRLEALVAQKQASGTDLVHPDPVEQERENVAEVIDLLDVLRKSLGQADRGNANKARGSDRGNAKRTTKDGDTRKTLHKASAKKPVVKAQPRRSTREKRRAS